MNLPKPVIKLTVVLSAALCLALAVPVAAHASDSAGVGFLDSDSHIRFMNGSNDGLFHPESNLTRAEIAQIIFSILDGGGLPAPTDNILDVSESDWYNDPVGALVKAGIMDLYDMTGETGYFRPDEQVTRAQLVYYLSKIGGVSEAQGSFTDVQEDYWAYREIMSAAEKGWVTGYEDGSFRPAGLVTRAEAAAIFNRAMGREADERILSGDNELRIFPDVSADYWAYSNIMEATVEHDITREPDGSEIWTRYAREKTVLPPGYYNFNGALYCVSEESGDFIRNGSDGVRNYQSDGKYTSGNADIDHYIRSITESAADSSMTQHEKLKALFDYVINNYTYIPRKIIEKGAEDWEEEYAEAMFKDGKGNCYSFTAIYYYLCLNLGYDPVTVTGTAVDDSPHSWVEMTENGRQCVYDTELSYAHDDYIFDIPWDELPYEYKRD